MYYHLFDSPNAGLIIAVLLETVILLAWAFTSGRVKKVYILTGPLLAGLFLLLDYAVDTNREQLERVTRQIVQGAEDEDAAAIINLLSDNLLLDNGFRKEQASQVIAQRLSKPLIATNSIRSLEVTSAGEQSGRVEFAVLTTIDPQSNYAMIPVVGSSWLFEYVRDSDGQFRVKNMIMLKFRNGPGFDIFKGWPRL